MPDVRSHPSHPECRRRPSGRHAIARAVVTELAVALEPACRDPFLDGCGDSPRFRPSPAPPRGRPGDSRSAGADSPPTTALEGVAPRAATAGAAAHAAAPHRHRRRTRHGRPRGRRRRPRRPPPPRRALRAAAAARRPLLPAQLVGRGRRDPGDLAAVPPARPLAARAVRRRRLAGHHGAPPEPVAAPAPRARAAQRRPRVRRGRRLGRARGRAARGRAQHAAPWRARAAAGAAART